MDKRQRLKLAVQKSGRLTDHSLDLLVRCGLKYSRGKDQLMCYGENMPLDVLFVRDDDIPDLVQEDVCDLGLVGLNVIEEKRLALAARGGRALFDRSSSSTSAAAACRSRCPRDGLRGPADLPASASPRPIRTCWRDSCASATPGRDRHACPAPSKSRRASAAPT